MDIPFESFAALIYRLGHPPKLNKSTEKLIATPPSKIFASWLNHLSKPLHNHTGNHLFRLLFPHEGSRRRYGLKETKLSAELERLLGVRGLARWDSVTWDRGGEGGTGCLGREVELIMKNRISRKTRSTLSIAELDGILDELATLSTFSQLSQPPSRPRSPMSVLRLLYRDSGLSPYALSVLTQIILRDLRPLLSPLPHLPIRNPTAMLRLKSTAGPAQMTLYEAMRCWNPQMAEMYFGGKGSMDWCAEMAGTSRDQPFVPAGPLVGVNVQIPKCQKGRSLKDALQAFCGSNTVLPARAVWAETKYDGYRMQIHVEVIGNGQPRITVFSKSKRNSTMDRLNTHSIILAALGLFAHPSLPSHPSLSERVSASTSPRSRIRRSVILEAEVVPYNGGPREGDRGSGIEEFWLLSAAGVTAEESTSDPLERPIGAARTRHLCLVFFDILHLDGKNLLQQTYERRRQALEDVISEIPGFSLLAERTCIPLMTNRQSALESLQAVFDRSNEHREEGLVLKAADSTYTNMLWQWVKLKKDYIPHLGDCIDLVILGAGWDIDRARELRVDTSVFTTFYLGVLRNHEQVKSRVETPHFEMLFRASYGVDRGQLEVYNENIRHGSWASKPYDKDDPLKRRLLGLSWTYRMPRGIMPPSVLFEQPLCAEVMGSGFQKLPESTYFELRFPRLQKIFDPRERSWIEALHGRDFIATAHRSLGYLSSLTASPANDSIGAAWLSSSTVALTDIPDFPSPSPERPSPRRMRSAPEILKFSPPTPISTSRPQPIRSVLQTAARLQNAMLEDNASIGLGTSQWMKTPVTSPIRAQTLASPLFTPSPEKRKRADFRIDETSPPRLERPSIPITPPRQLSVSRRLPPRLPLSSSPRFSFSPKNSTLSSSRPLVENLVAGHGDLDMVPSRKKKRLKPLSLRSRIRLVLRSALPARVSTIA